MPVVHDDAVSSCLFGRRRAVSAREHFGQVFSVGCFDDPEAHRECRQPRSSDRVEEVAPNFLERHGRVGERARGEHDGELFATLATDDVVASQRGPQGLREHAQRAIARLVTMHVIELLEMIEVGHRDDEARSAATKHLHPVLERQTIEQTSQAVGRGLELRFRHHAEEPGAPHELRQCFEVLYRASGGLCWAQSSWITPTVGP